MERRWELPIQSKQVMQKVLSQRDNQKAQMDEELPSLVRVLTIMFDAK